MSRILFMLSAEGGASPPTPAPGPPEPPHLSEDDVLAVLDRVLPEWYLAPLRDPGPGYEYFRCVAAMLSRASLAIARTDASLFVLESGGPVLVEAAVEFYRSSSTNGAFVIKAGTIVRASATNRSYAVVDDVPFLNADLSVFGLVRAVAPGPEYAALGPATTADGTVLAGEIDAVVIPIMDPVFGEPTIQVRQVSDAGAGRSAVLDQLGLDRNLPRIAGEPDDVYSRRVHRLPDTVSPAALRRQLDAVFLPMGLTYQLIETWQNEYQTCYDAPDVDVVNPIMGRVAADCLALDDPRSTPFRGRLMDERDLMGGFVVVVPEVGSWSERSMAFDDDGVPVVTARGFRATCALDAPDVDGSGVRVPFLDGYDLLHDQFYKRVNDLLLQIKGGGTNSAVELQGQ